MSDYPLWAYRQQLEQKAVRELGYNNPYQDQKRNHAISITIDQKVQEFSNSQSQDFNNMVRDIKEQL